MAPRPRLLSMRCNFVVVCVALLFLGLSGPGCKTALGQNLDAASGRTSSLPLGSGDLVSVDVFATPELSGKFRISQTGNISLPQGGVVHLGGLSPVEASQAIEHQLRDNQIMLDPHVTVFVTEYASQGVIVLGEVKNPGTYTLLGEHSLYGALSAAGGVSATAGATITVSHPSSPSQKEVIPIDLTRYSDVARATSVNPGDTVFVSHAEMIYVFGDVAHPGAYPLIDGTPLNVVRAISLAQGLNRSASAKHISILRVSGTGTQTIPIDLNRILHSQAPDPLLQASDVLVVPTNHLSGFTDGSALSGATAAVLSALVTALIIR